MTLLFTLVFLTSCSIISSGDRHVIRGTRAYKNGDYSIAIDELNKALEKGVKRYKKENVLTVIGNSYNELKMHDEAIEEHKKAIEINKDYYVAWVNLGVAYRHKGDLDEAEKCYNEALKIKPEYGELHASLCALYIIKNEPEKAVKEFELAVKYDSELPIAYSNGSLAYAMMGNFEEAEKALKKAKQLGYKNSAILEEQINSLKNR